MTSAVDLKAQDPLNCSRRALVYFTLIGNKAPPTARGSSEVARIYLHTGNNGLSLVFEHYSIPIGRIFHLGRSHRCCPVRATGGSIPCGRYLLAPLTEN